MNNDTPLTNDMLLIARAAIELRHYGGAKGLQLLDELAWTDASEQDQGLNQLIQQIKSREIDLHEDGMNHGND